jgi:alkylated DNA nucleotide flippase Atl1
LRLLPTQDDRASFAACVNRDAAAGGRDPIGQAYRFFRSHVELPGPDDRQLDLGLLTTVVVERLAVVDITTGQGDNAPGIFQSLNATGVGLTQADLLRNLIFMLLPARGGEVHDQVWQPMEQLIGFDNLEGLARVDLQRRGVDATVDDVFRRHQDRLEAMSGSEEAVEEAVRDLALRARHYKRIIDPDSEEDEELRAGLWRLRRWGAQTSHPVLMAAYDLSERGLLAVEGMREVVSYIESYLVRRQLAGIPPNALNKIFVQFVGHLPPDEGFPHTLRRELSRPRLNWPPDGQLREAIRTRPFYVSGRSPQRKAILERLEQSYGHPERIDFGTSDLTIEHVLPQTLSEEWRAHLAGLGQDPQEVHRDLVHTLGNMTLTAFNGTLSNNPFERKRQIYSDSSLQLNHALAGNDAWGRAEILARADELADRAITTWPGPLPGTDQPPSSIDWSRVNAAIAAIPRGRWTTYGDLALLGGTAAMLVGQHIAATPGLDNAYRVLGPDGRPRPDFRWTAPGDARDVISVLSEDGVRFHGGAADMAQRITAPELSALIDDPDDNATGPAGSPPAEPAGDTAVREQVRRLLTSGLTSHEVYESMGATRACWLAILEEETRLAGELAAYPATPAEVAALRDERQLRWERIAARVYGDARQVDAVRSLYDQAHGQGAATRSYTGRGRRYPKMEP